LVAHWTFDEGDGNTAYDSAGNNDGAIYGANWTEGIIGGALLFDGVGDYVEVPDDDSLTPSSGITSSFWLYNEGGQTAGIYKYASCPDQPSSPGNSRAYNLSISDSTGQVGFTVWSTRSIYDGIGSNGIVALSEWHHVAATFDGGDAALYINGQADTCGTMSVSSIMNDAQPLIVGGYWQYCDNEFVSRLNGMADDVRIYSRALTEGEMGQVYCGGLGVPAIGVWPEPLEFYAHEAGSNPAPQTLYIRNIGPGISNWQVTEDCSWLEVDPNAGSSAAEPNEVTVSVDISGLTRGIYTCPLTISDPCACNNPRTVAAQLRIFYGGFDAGDAPEDGTNYPTTLARGGARHYLDIVNGPTVFLGEMIDEEVDGQPSAGADGDDANYMPDEDGVLFNTNLAPGDLAEVEVTASCEGKLDAWIDFNGDGDWADANEQIFASEPLTDGINMLTFGVPSDANLGQTYARFRFSTAGGLGYSGVTADGEVEDYAVQITDCMKTTHPDYDDWVSVGKPACWCYRKQCRGDIDGLREGPFPVSLNDLIIMRPCFNQVALPAGCECADLDHAQEGPFRVSLNDLNTIRPQFSQMVIPECDGTHINFWTN
jgi:hypothetical protein